LKGLVVAPELHVRQKADGCLVAGADFGGMDPGVDAEAAADELFAKVQQFLKGGEALKRARLSVGYRPLPRDGRPAIGMIPSVAGLYLCVSHSGITLAPALAAFGASEILGQGRHGLLGPFSPNRLVSVI
jgi:glycine/D-amino acid oxidase-like deaminating enzyme